MADIEINILTNDSGVPLVETESTNLYSLPSAFDKIREDIEINKQNISNNTQRIQTNEENIAKNIERISKNEENILENANSIETNKNEIDVLKQLVTISERYIDKYTGVESVEDFISTIDYPNIQNGDVIIYVQLIEQGTDKIYKIIRSVDNWVSYEIPAIEAAEFDSLGSIIGTYKLNDDKYAELPFLVKIESGIIQNIYIKKENNEYVEINNYLKEIDNIKNDYITSNLLSQALTLYMTKDDGATKGFVREYALPKTIFGDVNYYTEGDFISSIPNYNEPIASTEPLIAPGNYILKEVDKIFNYSFEIGKNNSLINNIWLSSNKDVEIKVKISAYYKRFNSKALLYYSSIDESGYDELGSIITPSTTIKDGALVNFSTPLTFSSLENNIINMEANSIIKIKIEIVNESSDGAIISLYSNEVYPSSMQLSSWAIVDYVTKATKLSQLENDLGFIDKNVEDLTNYYDKSLTYTKEELDERISAIPKYKTLVVNELPEIGEIDVIYLVPDINAESGNLYTEYFYVNDKWEMLGTQKLDLSGYALKSSVDEHIANKNNPHQVTKSQIGLGSVVNAGQAETMAEDSLEYYTAGAAYSDIKPIQDKAHEHTNKAVLDTIDGFIESSAFVLEDKPTLNSNNPVSSGGVYSALEKKQDTLTFDERPTQGSNNSLTSGVIYNALSQKQNTLIFDTSVIDGSSNPVTSSAVYNYVVQKLSENDIINREVATIDDVDTSMFVIME